MEQNEDRQHKDTQHIVEKVICSGIPEHRILVYFDQESEVDPEFVSKCPENASDNVKYRFDACLITVRPNPNPAIIRPVVPMTDIVFSGEEAAVEWRMERYRKFFLSAGG